ncbi:hypothetical protein D9611_012866 [Ephemerocybe angulata]|uniref:Protein kinase domain-containing protein n=1 Tax=Ephemerocybe angulata TaxID=980116 RepID=A0A8H5F155_9AGAR|nr:hypothetical protein D9611_012866 [Tulosesus angulatus]
MRLSNVKEENKTKTVSDALIWPAEELWVEYYYFLEECGYTLRRRYHPDLIPSWRDKGPKPPYPRPEDAILGLPRVVDATCEDGRKVMLKHISLASQELPISNYVSTEPRTDDPRNRCIPILDVIMIPACDTHAILVMPLLYEHSALPFRHVGELLEMTLQLAECLEFLHDHNIAHRDFCYYNVMIDAWKLIPGGFHPLDPNCMPEGKHHESPGGFKWRSQWSVRPNTYYVIDFGFSEKFDKTMGIRVTGICGQDISVPEMSLTVPYDPFPVDAYHLGNMLLKYYNDYTPNNGLSRLKDIAQKMTQVDPKARPTAREVAEDVRKASKAIGFISRSSRIWPTADSSGLFKLLIRLGVMNPIRIFKIYSVTRFCSIRPRHYFDMAPPGYFSDVQLSIQRVTSALKNPTSDVWNSTSNKSVSITDIFIWVDMTLPEIEERINGMSDEKKRLTFARDLALVQSSYERLTILRDTSKREGDN